MQACVYGLARVSYRGVAAAGQAGSQNLLPGSGSMIMHDIMCAQLEIVIAEGVWDRAYMQAVELHPNLANMYHKARRPASNIQPLSCLQHMASLFNILRYAKASWWASLDSTCAGDNSPLIRKLCENW